MKRVAFLMLALSLASCAVKPVTGDRQLAQAAEHPDLPWSFQVIDEAEQNRLGGVVTFIELEGRTYQVLGYALAQQRASHERTFRATMNSFARPDQSPCPRPAAAAGDRGKTAGNASP